MTDLKFSILEILYSKRPYRSIDKTELLNLRLSNVVETMYALDELEAMKYVKTSSLANNVELTPQGANAYESEKETRDDRAHEDAQKTSEQSANAAQIHEQQKKQFRHDFFIVIFTLLCSLLVEYLPKLFQILVSVFQ